MKIADRFLTYLYLVTMALYFILIVEDTIHVIIDPTGYITAYGFTEYSEYWSAKSITNYIISGLLMLVVIVGLFFIGIKKVMNKSGKKIWVILFYAVFTILAGLLIRGYYEWAAGGFDH